MDPTRSDAGSGEQLLGLTVYDRDGRSIGVVCQVHLDDATGAPLFMMLDGAGGAVPVAGLELDGDSIQVPYAAAMVADAPTIRVSDGRLGPGDEDRFYAHYGLAAAPRTDATTSEVDRSPNPSTRSGAAMVRSEEHLQADVRTVIWGRVRMRRYVVTEMETVTVPVRKERVVLEQLPAGAATLSDGGADGLSAFSVPPSGVVHEMVRHEEQIVVTTVVVPIERYQLIKEIRVEDRTATDAVRREHIEVQVDDSADVVDVDLYEPTRDA